MEDIDRVVELAKSHLGRVDFLFVNAGIAKFAPFEAVDERLWDEQQDINVRGAFFTVQKLAPLVPRGGAIVLNASVVASKGFPGDDGVFRLEGRPPFARTHTRHGAPSAWNPCERRQSRADCDTDFREIERPPEARAAMAEQFRESVPMKRFGQPEEVARAAVFLAFEATFTTGADLPVDGGIGQV